MDTLANVDVEQLREFSPLDTLPEKQLAHIADQAQVEELPAGSVVIDPSQNQQQSIFLLHGELALSFPGSPEPTTLSHDGPEAKYSVSGTKNNNASVSAATDVEIVRIDNELIDTMMTWSQLSTHEYASEAWVSNLFNIFKHLPAANISQLIERMENIHVAEGQTIIEQGDDGDYFYAIREGQALVTREFSGEEGDSIEVAELPTGTCFGQDALMTNNKRNATVSMTTPGELMRLSKSDFQALLKEPMLKWVGPAEAKALIDGDAQWLDIRLPSEFQQARFPGSINLPLHLLRKQLDRLDPNRRYVICCSTGRRSSAAAFILMSEGFDVCILRDGIDGVAKAKQARQQA